MRVEHDEKVVKVRCQRSRSYVYKGVKGWRQRAA